MVAEFPKYRKKVSGGNYERNELDGRKIVIV